MYIKMLIPFPFLMCILFATHYHGFWYIDNNCNKGGILNNHQSENCKISL